MAAAFPLLDGFRADSTIGWSHGEPISAARFCATALALADALPRKRHVLNLCEDRLNFMLALAAALIAGQVSLLPQSRAAAALRELFASHPDSYCLADDSDLPAGLPAIVIPSWCDAGGMKEVPLISGDQVAQIAFTSGSTGHPQPHTRTWGSLVAGARFLAGHLGIARGEDYSILGTVPAQHVYGFDTTVMLSLQNGVPMHSGRPLLPADIAAALHDLPGKHWLATTPTHLRACVVEETRLSGLAGVICATMPLAPELVQAVERMWAATIHEIYGCTEAGVVALRRPGRGERWRVTSGMRLWKKGEDTWVEGGHLEQALKLPDRIELASETEFTLMGRPGDLVKVAGNRASLEALNRELLCIPGVKDGVFFVPDSPSGSEARLAALVVAPRLDPETIVCALRERIDPAFLPRPLLIVDALPRNATGKLPREGLLALARAAQSRSQRSA